MAKKVLIVDDSALMRRVLCDIIDSDERFQVADRAANGLEALELLERKTYDAVVLDVNMPKMNGLELLEELRGRGITARVMMASTDTREGARTTLDALELGALDFIHKPDSTVGCRGEEFRAQFLNTLDAVANSNPGAAVRRRPSGPARSGTKAGQAGTAQTDEALRRVLAKRDNRVCAGSKVVAIASSTGGPKALQEVIPRLPGGLNAPVLLVQHMPKGFTASLAERLNEISEVRVKEAEDGDVLEKGCVYIARGGSHLRVDDRPGGRAVIRLSDEPAREGVKPCANYMYESLAQTGYQQVVAVVMTGMGADGTEGIANLKRDKSIYVLTQSQETCVVYGMPKNTVAAGLSDQVVSLDQLAQEIILQVGVQ